jgi:outer membrane lipoprotein SlyB
MGGTAIEDKVGKSKKAEKSMDIPWTKSEFDNFVKGVLGAGIGGVAGGLLGGPVGAAAGAMGGTAIEDKISKPKAPKPPETEDAIEDSLDKQLDKGTMGQVAGTVAGDAVAPGVGGMVGGAAGKTLGSQLGKQADPKMIKDKCVKLCKAIAKSENGSEDLTSLTTEQFNRAFIQASYEMQKAVAVEPETDIRPRVPTTDFGGESEISASPVNADVHDLADKSETLNTYEGMTTTKTNKPTKSKDDK